MEKEIDPQIIKETQTSLGKYVKRPPLSEKLLKKPPFRFLHDIITSVSAYIFQSTFRNTLRKLKIAMTSKMHFSSDVC